MIFWPEWRENVRETELETKLDGAREKIQTELETRPRQSYEQRKFQMVQAFVKWPDFELGSKDKAGLGQGQRFAE